MTKLLLCLLPVLWLASPAHAVDTDAAQRAAAERFLRLARAEGMTAPLYDQVGRLMHARFAQLGGSLQYEDVLRDYQQQARALLDQELAWETLREPLIELYLPLFTTEEFEQLSAFYESEVGRRLMDNLQMLSSESMALVNQRWEQRLAPRMQDLLEQMADDIEQRQAPVGGLPVTPAQESPEQP